MADEPISALTQIAAPSGNPPYPTAFTNPTTGAMIEILDTTNTSMASTGTNSKIAPGDMIKGFLAAGANVTLTETSGVVTVAAASGGSPGGTSGQIQTNNGSGGFGALAVPLGVSSGGTGLGTLTANAVMLGEGTSTPGFATIGTSGRLLIDQGAAADPAFKVASGDVTVAASGAHTIAAGAVTTAKQANMVSSSLMGNPTGSPAAPSAITLGANLSFSGTTLVASASSGMTNPMTTTGDIIYGTNTASPSTPGRLGIGSTGNVLTVAGGIPSWAAPATSGTVTSVGLSTNAGWLTVGSSPITSSGTITLNATTGQTANQVLATPDGTTGVTGLRALVTGDIPTLAASKVTAPGSTGQLVYNSSNALTGATDWSIGASGQLVGTAIGAPSTAIGNFWFDSARDTYGFVSGNSAAGLATSLGGVIWQAGGAGSVVTLSTSTANTVLTGFSSAIGSLTIPANSLSAGKIIRIVLFGTMVVPSGTPTATISVFLGATSVWSQTSAALTAATGGSFLMGPMGVMGLQVQTVGASGTVIGHMWCYVASTNTNISTLAGGTATGTTANNWVAPVAVTIDTTGALAIDVRGKASAGVITIQITGGYVTIDG